MTKMQTTRRRDEPPLLSMLLSAYAADPKDWVICAVTDGRYSTVRGLIPAALAVLRVAAEIEAEPTMLMAWYRYTTIAELGHLTAEQLVSLGRAEAIIEFLSAIRSGQRG